MSKCQCITAKGIQCKLYASKKPADDNRFCWHHQNCQQLAKNNPKKDVKKSPKKVVKKSPKKVVKKSPKKVVKKVVKNSPKIGKKEIETINDVSNKGYNWCKFPDVIKANLIQNLNRFDINKACLANKDCQTMCNNNNFWKGLVQANYGKQVPGGKNARKYYYDLGSSAYIFGNFKPKDVDLPENVDKDDFSLVMKSVRHAVIGLYMSLFLTADDELYGHNKGKTGIELLHQNVKMFWLDSYSHGYYILTNDNDLCEVYKGNIKILMSEVSSVVFSGKIIYANDVAFQKIIDNRRYYSQEKFGENFSVNVNNQIVKFLYKEEPINIIKWYSYFAENESMTNLLVDDNNTLYAVIDDKTFKLAKNVEKVRLAYHDEDQCAIYWTIGSVFYRYVDGKTINWKLDSKIKNISTRLDYNLILTVDGTLYLQVIRDLLKGNVYEKLLPYDFKYTDDISAPFPIKSNVYQFSDFGSDEALLIIS